MYAHYDSRGVDGINHATTASDDGHARVDRNRTLHTGTDERSVRAKGRDRLTLHVRSHERAVRVVVLKERNHGSGNRHDLLRRDVHVIDAITRHQGEFVLVTARDQVV